MYVVYWRDLNHCYTHHRDAVHRIFYETDESFWIGAVGSIFMVPGSIDPMED